MMKYQINSRRKHFYACQLCSFVYINLEALQNHYTSIHPELNCNVVEYDSDPYEDVLDDYNKSSTTNMSLFRDDISISNNHFNNINIISTNDNHGLQMANSQIIDTATTNNTNTFNNNIHHNNSIALNAYPVQLNAASVGVTFKKNSTLAQNVDLIGNNDFQPHQQQQQQQQQNGKVAKKSKPNKQCFQVAQQPQQTSSLQPTAAFLPAGNFILQTANASNIATIPYGNLQLNTISAATNILNIQNDGKIEKIRPKCDICQKTFANQRNKRKHYENVHHQILSSSKSKAFPSNAQNPININNISVLTNQRIPYQLIPHNSIPAFVAQQQQQQFSLHDLNQTTVSIGGEPLIVTANKKSNKYEKEKTIQCPKCSKKFSTSYNQRRHEEMVHGQNAREMPKFKCSSCDKVFSSIYNKTRHENVHRPITERLKHICPQCRKGFTTQFILKSHLQKVHQLIIR